MILPAKHLPAGRALLTLGATILNLIDEPQTVSALWDQLRASRDFQDSKDRISYDWFVLSLDLLFLMGTVDYAKGLIVRARR